MSADNIRAMEAWEPHHQLSLAQARKRTQMVRYIRLGLVAAASITFGVFLAFVARNAFDRVGNNSLVLDADQSVAMVNPRFTGRDGAGSLYVITADSAQQRRENEDLVDLTTAKLVDAFGREVTAPRGLYDRANETLDLYDDVLVIDERGYVFNSTHARVFPNTGRVAGLEPLDGTGPLGDIRSDSYELERDSGIVTFRGRVQTIFFDDDNVQEESSP